MSALRSRARIEYAGQMRDVDVAIFSDAPPYDYIFAGGALDVAALEVDFEHAHGCLTKK